MWECDRSCGNLTGHGGNEFSVMDNTARKELCKKYIGGLMMEKALTDGTQPDLSRRAAFLLSTLQSPHHCLIGRDLTVLPEGNERCARTHIREYARKLLEVAGTGDEERDEANGGSIEGVAEPVSVPEPSEDAPPQETKAQKRYLLSTGKFPVFGEQRKHLHAHLATNKPGQGWSAEKYERWLYEKQSEGQKDRHRVCECPKAGCLWTGVKLEKHLMKHGSKANSREMDRLKASSKALSRKEYSRKLQAKEEASGPSSKKMAQSRGTRVFFWGWR